MRSGIQPQVATDVEEARLLAGSLLYPQQLDVLEHSVPFAMALHAERIGPLLIVNCEYTSDVRISCGNLTDSYHVNVPLIGELATRQGHSSMLATPRVAAVYRPVGDTVLDRWTGGSEMLCVKIDKPALEMALADITRRDVAEPIDFEMAMDVDSGLGRTWVNLVVTLYAELQRSAGAFPALLAAPLAESLLLGLLAAANHSHRGAFDVEPGTVRSPTVRKAVAYMEEHAGDPLTVADIAAHCAISVRALQEGFQREFGFPPLRYLRGIRLRRVRTDLVDGDPSRETVGEIANRWGFAHLGRFAAIYEARYGESPSHTLRFGG